MKVWMSYRGNISIDYQEYGKKNSILIDKYANRLLNFVHFSERNASHRNSHSGRPGHRLSVIRPVTNTHKYTHTQTCTFDT